MAALYERLLELFRLKKGTLETANRATLDRFVQRTELQRRRQALFSASCKPGRQKSRVTLCRKKNRPPFAIQMSTLSTKELRRTIIDFLEDIGLHKGQGKTPQQLERLAKKHKWSSVLYLSDEVPMDHDESETEEQKSEKKGSGLSVQGKETQEPKKKSWHVL